VKVDTGARTSALGVVSYELAPGDGGRLVADLRVAPSRRHPDRVVNVRTEVLEMVVVRNSGGMKEQRPLIETPVLLGSLVKRLRLTVTNRSCMLFPVILGRKALEGDFVVDVARKYLLRRTKA
jgi:hypothetical protein